MCKPLIVEDRTGRCDLHDLLGDEDTWVPDYIGRAQASTPAAILLRALMPFGQADPRPAPIFVNELDAGVFECLPKGYQNRSYRTSCVGFEMSDRP